MYSNRCRLCLEDNALDLFDERLQGNTQLRTYIHLTTGIEIKETDKAPRKVCSRCCMLAIKLLKYRTTAALNDIFLKKIFDDIVGTPKSGNEKDRSENPAKQLGKSSNTILNKRYGNKRIRRMLDLSLKQIGKTPQNGPVRTLPGTEWDPVVWLERLDLEKVLHELRKTKQDKISTDFNGIDNNETIVPNVLKVNNLIIKRIPRNTVKDTNLKDVPGEIHTVEDNSPSYEIYEVKNTTSERLPCESVINNDIVVQPPLCGNSTTKDETSQDVLCQSSMALENQLCEKNDNNIQTNNPTESTIQTIDKDMTEQLNQSLKHDSRSIMDKSTTPDCNDKDCEVIATNKAKTPKDSEQFQKPKIQKMVHEISTLSLEPTPHMQIENIAQKPSNLLSPSGKAESIFVCSLCQNMFDTKKELETHKRTHLKCKFCKQKVTSLENLSSHMKDSCLVLEKNMPVLCISKVDNISCAIAKYRDVFEKTELLSPAVKTAATEKSTVLTDTMVENEIKTIQVDENWDETKDRIGDDLQTKTDEADPMCTAFQETMAKIPNLLCSDKIESVSVVHPLVNCLNSQSMPNILFRDNIMQLLFSKHVKSEDKSTDPINANLASVQISEGRVYFKGLFRDLNLWRTPVHFCNHSTIVARYIPPKPAPIRQQFLRWSHVNPRGLIHKEISPDMLANIYYPPTTSIPTTAKHPININNSRSRKSNPRAQQTTVRKTTAPLVTHNSERQSILNPTLPSYSIQPCSIPAPQSHYSIVTNVPNNTGNVNFGNISFSDMQMNIAKSHTSYPQSAPNIVPVSSNSVIRVRNLSELTNHIK